MGATFREGVGMLGLALLGLGFVCHFGLLTSLGAISKSKQLGAWFDAITGRRGSAPKIIARANLLALMVGLPLLFLGFALGDSARRQSCAQECRTRGFTAGVIRGSKQIDPVRPNKHLFVACACTGQGETLELDASTLK